MSCNSPYMPIRAKLLDVITETSNIKTFVMKPEKPVPFKAGQFVALTIPGVGEAPFTPSSSPEVQDQLDVTIMRVGSVTERLHALKPGAEIGIRGPLGNPYPLDVYKGHEVLVVGGGVGLAPLRALLFALFQDIKAYKKIIVRFGSRSPTDIVYRNALQDAWGRSGEIDFRLTVDRGDDMWKGHTGVVTTIMEPAELNCDSKNGIAVVCGPPIMMKFATLKLLERGYTADRIYLSMEKNMSCGIGKCGHCRLGPYYACKDGPVFTYAQVKDTPKVWD